MALTNASLPAKRRILAVCVKLFLEQGYKKTTVAEIVQKADVSNSSFQNIFRAKDGVLTELVAFMFETQFDMARRTTDGQLSPLYVYAVETCIQLTLTELNENLRAYHVPEAEIAQAVAFIEGLNMSFDDAFDVSGYAVPAMQWACGAGVMQGANGKLLPTAEATRAQTAAMLHRFCEDVLK